MAVDDVSVEEMDNGQLKVTINAVKYENAVLKASLAEAALAAEQNHWKGFWSGMLTTFGVILIGGFLMAPSRRSQRLSKKGSFPVLIVERGPVLHDMAAQPVGAPVEVK